jgi:hypothetical protein
MSKMSMEVYSMIVAQALGIPRRQREMLERALVAKREAEDAARIKKVEGKPTVAMTP